MATPKDTDDHQQDRWDCEHLMAGHIPVEIVSKICWSMLLLHSKVCKYLIYHQ